jgi:hypothetical protein
MSGKDEAEEQDPQPGMSRKETEGVQVGNDWESGVSTVNWVEMWQYAAQLWMERGRNAAVLPGGVEVRLLASGRVRANRSLAIPSKKKKGDTSTSLVYKC